MFIKLICDVHHLATQTEPVTLANLFPYLILVCACELGCVMARHCLVCDHCQKDNIAGLWKLLYTYGSNVAHLHTVRHTFYFDLVWLRTINLTLSMPSQGC